MSHINKKHLKLYNLETIVGNMVYQQKSYSNILIDSNIINKYKIHIQIKWGYQVWFHKTQPVKCLGSKSLLQRDFVRISLDQQYKSKINS